MGSGGVGLYSRYVEVPTFNKYKKSSICNSQKKEFKKFIDECLCSKISFFIFFGGRMLSEEGEGGEGGMTGIPSRQY